MPCRPIDIYGFLRKGEEEGGTRHDTIQPSPILNLCWRGPFAAAAARHHVPYPLPVRPLGLSSFPGGP